MRNYRYPWINTEPLTSIVSHFNRKLEDSLKQFHFFLGGAVKIFGILSVLTWSNSSKIFPGTPCDLDKTEPLTKSYWAQWFLWKYLSPPGKLLYFRIDWKENNQLAMNLKFPSWKKCYIRQMVKRLCFIRAKLIDWKSGAASITKRLEEHREK